MTISLLLLTKYTDSDLYGAPAGSMTPTASTTSSTLCRADGHPLTRTRIVSPGTRGRAAGQRPTLPGPGRTTAPGLRAGGSRSGHQAGVANRYTKAAQLVEAGQVRLTGPETAEVTGSSDTYQVNGKCHCEWTKFHSDPCSHYLAVRMARALAQPIAPVTEAEKEAAHAARVQANKDAAQLRVAGAAKMNQRQPGAPGPHERGPGATPSWRRPTARPACHDIWQRANGHGLLAG